MSPVTSSSSGDSSGRDSRLAAAAAAATAAASAATNEEVGRSGPHIMTVGRTQRVLTTPPAAANTFTIAVGEGEGVDERAVSEGGQGRLYPPIAGNSAAANRCTTYVVGMAGEASPVEDAPVVPARSAGGAAAGFSDRPHLLLPNRSTPGSSIAGSEAGEAGGGGPLAASPAVVAHAAATAASAVQSKVADGNDGCSRSSSSGSVDVTNVKLGGGTPSAHTAAAAIVAAAVPLTVDSGGDGEGSLTPPPATLVITTPTFLLGGGGGSSSDWSRPNSTVQQLQRLQLDQQQQQQQHLPTSTSSSPPSIGTGVGGGGLAATGANYILSPVAAASKGSVINSGRVRGQVSSVGASPGPIAAAAAYAAAQAQLHGSQQRGGDLLPFSAASTSMPTVPVPQATAASAVFLPGTSLFASTTQPAPPPSLVSAVIHAVSDLTAASSTPTVSGAAHTQVAAFPPSFSSTYPAASSYGLSVGPASRMAMPVSPSTSASAPSSNPVTPTAPPSGIPRGFFGERGGTPSSSAGGAPEDITTAHATPAHAPAPSPPFAGGPHFVAPSPGRHAFAYGAGAALSQLHKSHADVPVGPCRLVMALSHALVRLAPANCGEYEHVLKAACTAGSADEGVARYLLARVLDSWPRADADKEKLLIQFLSTSLPWWVSGLPRPGGTCMDVDAEECGVRLEPAHTLVRRVVARVCIAVRSRHIAVANDAILQCLPRVLPSTRGRAAPSPLGAYLLTDPLSLMAVVKALEANVGVVRLPRWALQQQRKAADAAAAAEAEAAATPLSASRPQQHQRDAPRSLSSPERDGGGYTSAAASTPVTPPRRVGTPLQSPPAHSFPSSTVALPTTTAPTGAGFGSGGGISLHARTSSAPPVSPHTPLSSKLMGTPTGYSGVDSPTIGGTPSQQQYRRNSQRRRPSSSSSRRGGVIARRADSDSGSPNATTDDESSASESSIGSVDGDGEEYLSGAEMREDDTPSTTTSSVVSGAGVSAASATENDGDGGVARSPSVAGMGSVFPQRVEHSSVKGKGGKLQDQQRRGRAHSTEERPLDQYQQQQQRQQQQQGSPVHRQTSSSSKATNTKASRAGGGHPFAWWRDPVLSALSSSHTRTVPTPPSLLIWPSPTSQCPQRGGALSVDGRPEPSSISVSKALTVRAGGVGGGAGAGGIGAVLHGDTDTSHVSTVDAYSTGVKRAHGSENSSSGSGGSGSGSASSSGIAESAASSSSTTTSSDVSAPTGMEVVTTPSPAPAAATTAAAATATPAAAGTGLAATMAGGAASSASSSTWGSPPRPTIPLRRAMSGIPFMGTGNTTASGNGGGESPDRTAVNNRGSGGGVGVDSRHLRQHRHGSRHPQPQTSDNSRGEGHAEESSNNSQGGGGDGSRSRSHGQLQTPQHAPPPQSTTPHTSRSSRHTSATATSSRSKSAAHLRRKHVRQLVLASLTLSDSVLMANEVYTGQQRVAAAAAADAAAAAAARTTGPSPPQLLPSPHQQQQSPQRMWQQQQQGVASPLPSVIALAASALTGGGGGRASQFPTLHAAEPVAGHWSPQIRYNSLILLGVLEKSLKDKVASLQVRYKRTVRWMGVF